MRTEAELAKISDDLIAKKWPYPNPIPRSVGYEAYNHPDMIRELVAQELGIELTADEAQEVAYFIETEWELTGGQDDD